jgi:hypothetical protein
VISTSLFTEKITVKLTIIGSCASVVNAVIWTSADLIFVGEIGISSRPKLTEGRLLLEQQLMTYITTGFRRIPQHFEETFLKES